MGNIAGTIVLWLLRAVVVLLAISVHETAHGFAAYKLGDYTAKSMGRLSLNPLRHLDPMGALCMLIFLNKNRLDNLTRLCSLKLSAKLLI